MGRVPNVASLPGEAGATQSRHAPGVVVCAALPANLSWLARERCDLVSEASPVLRRAGATDRHGTSTGSVRSDVRGEEKGAD